MIKSERASDKRPINHRETTTSPALQADLVPPTLYAEKLLRYVYYYYYNDCFHLPPPVCTGGRRITSQIVVVEASHERDEFRADETTAAVRTNDTRTIQENRLVRKKRRRIVDERARERTRTNTRTHTHTRTHGRRNIAGGLFRRARVPRGGRRGSTDTERGRSATSTSFVVKVYR